MSRQLESFRIKSNPSEATMREPPHMHSHTATQSSANSSNLLNSSKKKKRNKRGASKDEWPAEAKMPEVGDSNFFTQSASRKDMITKAL